MINSENSINKLRCWVEINLQSLYKNIKLIKKISEGRELMAIVKANAYGHGLEKIVNALDSEVNFFGVATLEEAKLTKSYSTLNTPVLILSSACSWEVKDIINEEFSICISSIKEVDMFDDYANKIGKKSKLHVFVDTGMGREGVKRDKFVDFIKYIMSKRNCILEGISSHLSSADEDKEFTENQIESFLQCIEDVKKSKITLPKYIHILNSAGLISNLNLSYHFNLDRIGLAIYGISPIEESKYNKFEPILSWKSRIILIKKISKGDTISYGHTFVANKGLTIGIVSIGYGDGLPRILSNKQAKVLIKGHLCEIIGRITMDQIIIDISSIHNFVKTEDEVVIIGTQENQNISVDEVSQLSETIPWEIFTGITNRVKRVYID